ncbi:MAG: transcription termination factor NusA [Alphaproteobacteria bacterium]
MTTAAEHIELLQVADAVAREKGIDKEEVILAMEMAIQKAGRTKYGQEHDIRAIIDRKSGDISLSRWREVVEEVEDEVRQLTVAEAQQINKEYALGDFIKDPLPPIDFGRVAAQTARQVIIQRVREVERERQFEEYKDRVGEIINGVIKRIDFGNVFVDIGRAEALMRREEVIPRENMKVGERIRAYISEVRPETHGAQIFLSRTHPQFMAKLFEQEVPEIYDGVIEIKAAARDPGSRAKIAVYAGDASIDPLGACVGMRGSRVQAVIGEMQGEKIDIIPWTSDIATFVVNALTPAEIIRVIVEEEDNRVEVIVPDEQLSIAIGRRGQNVRLATQITGWDIDIRTETDDSKRRADAMEAHTKLFTEALDVDDVIARLLATEGFSSIEEVAYVELNELNTIEGFEDEISQEIQNRARDYLEEQEKINTEKFEKLGVTKELAELEGLSAKMLVVLGENEIKTLDDFADLAADEVVEMLESFKVTPEEASDMILAARAHWFEDEHHDDTLGQERVLEVEE